MAKRIAKESAGKERAPERVSALHATRVAVPRPPCAQPEGVIARFIRFVRIERGLGALTGKAYAADLALFSFFLLPQCDDAKLIGASTEDVRRFVVFMGEPRVRPTTAKRLKEGKKAATEIVSGLDKTTVRRRIASIRSFFSWAVHERLRIDDPAADIKGPKADKKLPKTLSMSEIDQLLSAAAPKDVDEFRFSRNRLMFELIYATGVRISELARIDLSDIDRERRSIRINGKGNKQRTVFFNETALAALNRYLAARPETAEDALFIGPHGSRLHTRMMRYAFEEAKRAANIHKHVTPHTLRHSFATHIIENGGDVTTVQKLLGHESLATTQIYADVSMEHVRGAYKRCHPRDSRQK